MSNNRAKSAEKPWSFEDLVDFEYATRLESHEAPDTVEKRDRRVLERAERTNRNTSSNRDLLKTWLDTVKESQFPKTWNPGELADNAIGFSSKIVFAIALVAGLTMAAGFLSYEGNEPVNVSAYVGVFVMLQLALAVVSIMLILILRWASSAFDCFLGIRILRPLFFHVAGSVVRYSASKVDSEHRSVLKDASGDLKSIWVIYRQILQRKVFTHFQSWAIAFNLGVIGATIVIVLFSDRAFGWQTTLQLDAEWLHQMVRFTALPWSWFAGDGVGYPSLSEIEGSRIVLKDGIRSLNSEDLVSWWPYLCLGATVYGLFPRLVFFAWGKLATNNSLKGLSFSHVEANRIAGRIRSRDQGFESSVDRSLSRTDSSDPSRSNGKPELNPVLGQGAICLLASDYHEELPHEEFRGELARILSLGVDQLELVNVSVEDLKEPDGFTLELDIRARVSLFVVFASWLPPIEESKQLIRAVRRNIDSNQPLYIKLLGPLNTNNELEEPKPEEVRIWKAFVRRLGDPYCALSLHDYE